jgi:hypothetical protein
MQPSKPCTPLTLNEPLTMPLHPAEEKLLRYMRALGYGSLEIRVSDGYPVLIEKSVQRIKLV